MKPKTIRELPPAEREGLNQDLRRQMEEQTEDTLTAEEKTAVAIEELAKASKEATGAAEKQISLSLGIMKDVLNALKERKEQPVNVQVSVPEVKAVKKWRHTRTGVGVWTSERIE